MADAGFRDETVGVAGVTVNPLKEADVPPGVVTVRFRGPEEAVGAIVIVAEIVVSVALLIVPVTPDPSNVSNVAPVRLVPVIVAGNVVPCVPDVGEIDVIFGTFVAPTVKLLNGAVELFLVMIASVRAPGAAP